MTNEKQTALEAKDGIMLQRAAVICTDMAELLKLIRMEQPLVTVSQ